MATITENLERLTAFADLQAGWDSYGAQPIHPRAIETARKVAAVLSSEWTAVPKSDRGIQFETADGAGEIVISFEE